jgi:hypothetical protein
MTTSHCSYSARHDHTCASKLIPFILVVLVRADWTDTSWHTSPEKFTVKAGDTMVSSIVYTSDNSYTMRITSKATGKTISTPYKIEAKQTTKETTAYFVLEHTPRKCAALSAAGEMSFENIYLEVVSDEPLVATLGCDPRQQTRPPSVLHGSVLHQPALPPALSQEGQQVKKPHWQPVKGARKCNAATTISDPATIKITWDTTGEGVPQNSTAPVRPERLGG